MFQRTIKNSIEFVGIGLHRGQPVRVVLEPLDADSGIVFYHLKSATSIPLTIDSVTNTKLATVIGKGDYTISTIEHFLSALYAYGIDNLRVIVDGDEMPIMDGSAISFALLLDEVGILEQDKPKKILKIKREVEVKEGNKWAKLTPSNKSLFDFAIDFNHPMIGYEHYRFIFDRKRYINEIARARTFGFVRDIQYLQSQNLALGASLENAIGLDEHSILNPEGLRYEDEFVRHKILDAMGDMKVVGYNILGEYASFAGSHSLNYQLGKKLLSDAKNYEIVAMNELKNPLFEKSFA